VGLQEPHTRSLPLVLQSVAVSGLPSAPSRKMLFAFFVSSGLGKPADVGPAMSSRE